MKKRVLLKLTVAALSLLTLIGLAQQLNSAQASPALKTKVEDSYGRLPISFEADRGQASGSVKFLAAVTGQEAVLTPHSPRPARVRSGAEIQGPARLPPGRRLGNRPPRFLCFQVSI